MSVFLQPYLLVNQASESLYYYFSNNSTTEYLCLFEGCSQSVDPDDQYNPADYPDASDTTYGMFIPTAISQDELNANNGKFETAVGIKYIWFQPNEDQYFLYESDSLSFGQGTLVQTNEPDVYVTPQNIGIVSLTAQDGAGGIIIIGVLDGSEEDA